MNYAPYVPLPDSQISLSPIFDSNSCGIFGLVDFIEIMVYFKTGLRVDYSKHGAATQAGIQNNVDSSGHIWGSYVADDLASIKKNGLLTQAQWPDVPNFTHDQFFAPIPPNLNGLDFLDQWELSDLLPPDGINPTLLEIKFPNGAVHFVVQINDTHYYDSYSPPIKPIGYNNSIILNKWTLKLTQKCMSNAQFVNKEGTQEYGFYFPALSEDALKDKALNVGFNILNPDGSINYGSAKKVSGLD